MTAVTRCYSYGSVLQLWLGVTAVSWCCRVDDVSEKYSQLEDEFRLALHVEAKRFTEVPRAPPATPLVSACHSCSHVVLVSLASTFCASMVCSRVLEVDESSHVSPGLLPISSVIFLVSM